MDMESIANYITQWLLTYAEQAQLKGWVVGVSGGIDSAVTSTLCAKTGLPTALVEMPIHQHPEQVNRAQNHMQNLNERFANTESIRVDLSSVYDQFVHSLPKSEDLSNGLALANSRARLRMTTLYALAAQRNALVAGTGNKVEDFGVGFYTKYGDGGVDVSPIADLVKTEVFALGRVLGVDASILNAPPTDGLWGDDRTDEDQLGASYPELEWAMANANEVSSSWTPRQEEVMKIYLRLNRANRHKMEPVPVCIIPESLRQSDQA